MMLKDWIINVVLFANDNCSKILYIIMLKVVCEMFFFNVKDEVNGRRTFFVPVVSCMKNIVTIPLFSYC